MTLSILVNIFEYLFLLKSSLWFYQDPVSLRAEADKARELLAQPAPPVAHNPTVPRKR